MISDTRAVLSTAAASKKRWAWTALRWGLVTGVVVLVGVNLYERWEKAETYDLQLRPAWLFVAGLLYLAGWLPAALWWRRVMQAMGQKPALVPVLRAYYVGHLGKYVPGKAMVVVIRAWLLHRARVPTTLAATSAVYETLSTMAVGTLLSGMILLRTTSARNSWTQLAALLLVLAGLPMVPAVFNRILGWLSVPLRQSQPLAIRGLGAGSLLLGVLVLSAGWIVTGLSLGATLQGIGAIETSSFATSLGDLPQWTSSVALAVVAGFLAVWFPAGVGVREGVLVSTLSPTVGTASAVSVAVVWRFVSILSEASVGTFFYLLPDRASALETPSVTDQE